LSLWCAAWLKSPDRKSWTSQAIISPSSSVIIYYGDVLWAFDFLCMLPGCVAGPLFSHASCGLGLVVVYCASSSCFFFSLASCIFSFSPFWVPVFIGPSSIYVILPWPVLHLLGTWIARGCVSPCSSSSFVVLYGTSWVMDGILHSSSHSPMTMLMSPSVIQ
jgi:hypothetical protein